MKHLPASVNFGFLVCAMLAFVTPVNATTVLHYGFDNNFFDDSGNNNHGILEDLHGTPASFLTGVQGTDFQFGTHSWNSPNASDKVAFTIPFTPAVGETWSTAFWYDMGPLGGGGGAGTPLFSDANGNNMFQVRADAQNGAFATIAGQAQVQWASNLTMNRNWNHYVIVANGSGVDLDGIAGDDALVLYFNGSPVTPDAGVDLTNILTNIVFDNIGDGVPNDGTASEAFRGGIGVYDELWIFDAALSGDQVQDLFLTNTPPVTGGGGGGIPEPTTAALGLLGIATISLRRRRAVAIQ